MHTTSSAKARGLTFTNPNSNFNRSHSNHNKLLSFASPAKKFCTKIETTSFTKSCSAIQVRDYQHGKKERTTREEKGEEEPLQQRSFRG
ncbi:hypothetical protein OIU76_019375 [Salix suchowensis]|nr:hypothetical protein OIU76_019375 [Salix suchowensis]